MRIDFAKVAVLGVMVVSAIASGFSDEIDPYVLQILMMIGINLILGVSLNLVTGYTGQFSLGHAGFMAVGAYTVAVLTTVGGPEVIHRMGGDSLLVKSLLYLVALILGGLVAALAGLVVGIPSLRLRGDYLAIVTLGFSEIIRVLIQNWDFVGASRGYSVVPGYANLFWVFTAAALTVYVVDRLVHSTYGCGFLATRDDEIAAEAMGVNTTRFKVVAFALGAFFAGIAGGLYAHVLGYINPSKFDFQMSFEIIIIVIVGGMGNTFGVVAAAVILAVLNEQLRSFAEYRMVLFSLLLIVLMILRPQGLLSGIPFRKWFGKKGGRLA